MNLAERFKSQFPASVLLDYSHGDWIQVLYRNSWIKSSDKILSIEKPGEGNMNFVVRIKTDSGSFIVKQSRPWVEKYPQIEAPVERIHVEAQFYQALAPDKFYEKFIPTLIGFDSKNFLLALEDLGESKDCTAIYDSNKYLNSKEYSELIDFASQLHNQSFSGTTYPDNLLLRRLNHTHIFQYPYLEENGFDLDTVQQGLQAVSMRYKKNEWLRQALNKLGEKYLQIGKTLIHGDYYPGSWLKTAKGIRIIDPEFSHFGSAEFDIGVFAAHLLMAHMPKGGVRKILSEYRVPVGFNIHLFAQFCGTEIMRRIIGLAQLPLHFSLEEKASLLDSAEQMVLKPHQQEIF